MVVIELIDWIVIISYSVICITFLTIGTVFIRKAKDKLGIVKNYLRGVGLFFLLYGISRVIMFTFEWSFPIVANMMTGTIEPGFIWNLSSDEIETIFLAYHNINMYHDFIWRLTTAIGTGGLIILLYQLEIHILEKKTKFIFTIIEIISVLPALIVGVMETGKDEITIVRIILYIGNAMMIIIPLTYLYLAFKTSGDTRKRALTATLGMFIMFLGVIFNSSIGKTIFANQVMVQYLLFGICVVVGSSICVKSIKY